MQSKMGEEISIEKRDMYMFNFSLISYPTWFLNIKITEYILFLQVDFNGLDF